MPPSSPSSAGMPLSPSFATALAPTAPRDKVARWLRDWPPSPLRTLFPRKAPSIVSVTPWDRARGFPDGRGSRSPSFRLLVSQSRTIGALAGALQVAIASRKSIVLDAGGDSTPAILGPSGPAVLSALLFGCIGQAQHEVVSTLREGPELGLELTRSSSAEVLPLTLLLPAGAVARDFAAPSASAAPTGAAVEAAAAAGARERLRGVAEGLRALARRAEPGAAHRVTDLEVLKALRGGARPGGSLRADLRPFTWTQRALAVAAEVVERIPLGRGAEPLPPIVVGGRTGVGKTYLLLKLQELMAQVPELGIDPVLYVQSFSAAFTEGVIFSAADNAVRRLPALEGDHRQITIFDEVTATPAQAAVDRVMCLGQSQDGWTSLVGGSNKCVPLFMATCNPEPLRDSVFEMSPAIASCLIKLEPPAGDGEFADLARTAFGPLDGRGPGFPNGLSLELAVSCTLAAKGALEATVAEGTGSLGVVTGREVVRCASMVRALLLPGGAGAQNGSKSSSLGPIIPLLCEDDPLTRDATAILLAVYHSFGMRTLPRTRFFAAVEDVGRRLGSPVLAGAERQLMSLRETVAKAYAPRPDIVPTHSFLENVLAITLAVATRQPLLILGNDGMSKSLAIKHTTKQMLGSVSSRTPLLKRGLPLAHVDFLQFSPRTSAESVRRQTTAVTSFTGDGSVLANFEGQVAVVVMEELTMADPGPHGPLRALHDLLDKHQTSEERKGSSTVGSGSNDFAFIATSNFRPGSRGLPVGEALGNRLSILVHPAIGSGDLNRRAIGAGNAWLERVRLVERVDGDPGAAPRGRLAELERRIGLVSGMIGNDRFGSIRGLTAFARAAFALLASEPDRPLDEVCMRAAACHLQTVAFPAPVGPLSSDKVWKELGAAGVFGQAPAAALSSPSPSVLGDLLNPLCPRRPLLVTYTCGRDLERWILAVRRAANDDLSSKPPAVIMGASWPAGPRGVLEQTQALFRIRCSLESGGLLFIVNPEGLLDGLHALLNDSADSNETTIQMRGSFENVLLHETSRIILLVERASASRLHPAVLSRVAVVNSGFPVPVHCDWLPDNLEVPAALEDATLRLKRGLLSRGEVDTAALCAAEVTLVDLLSSEGPPGPGGGRLGTPRILVATLAERSFGAARRLCQAEAEAGGAPSLLRHRVVFKEAAAYPSAEEFVADCQATFEEIVGQRDPDSADALSGGTSVTVLDLTGLRASEALGVLVLLGFVFPRSPQGLVDENSCDKESRVDSELRLLTRRVVDEKTSSEYPRAAVLILLSKGPRVPGGGGGRMWVPGQHMVVGDGGNKKKVPFHDRVLFFDVRDLTVPWPEWPRLPDLLRDEGVARASLQARALDVAAELFTHLPGVPEQQSAAVVGHLKELTELLLDGLFARMGAPGAKVGLDWAGMADEAERLGQSLRTTLIGVYRRAAFVAAEAVLSKVGVSCFLGLGRVPTQAAEVAKCMLRSDSLPFQRKLPSDAANKLEALASKDAARAAMSHARLPFPLLPQLVAAVRASVLNSPSKITPADVAAVLERAFPGFPDAAVPELCTGLARGLLMDLGQRWGHKLVRAQPSEACVEVLRHGTTKVSQVVARFLSGEPWAAVLVHFARQSHVPPSDSHQRSCLACAACAALSEVVAGGGSECWYLVEDGSWAAVLAVSRLVLSRSSEFPCLEKRTEGLLAGRPRDVVQLWDALAALKAEGDAVSQLTLARSLLEGRGRVPALPALSLGTESLLFLAARAFPRESLVACVVALHQAGGHALDFVAGWLVGLCEKRPQEVSIIAVLEGVFERMRGSGFSRELVAACASSVAGRGNSTRWLEGLIPEILNSANDVVRLCFGSKVVVAAVEGSVERVSTLVWPPWARQGALLPFFEEGSTCCEPLRMLLLRALMSRYDESGTARLLGLEREVGAWITEWTTGSWVEGDLAHLALVDGFNDAVLAARNARAGTGAAELAAADLLRVLEVLLGAVPSASPAPGLAGFPSSLWSLHSYWTALLASPELQASPLALPNFPRRVQALFLPCIGESLAGQLLAMQRVINPGNVAGVFILSANICACGYVYSIGDCGKPRVMEKCPGPEVRGGCSLQNGGQNHQHAPGQRLMTVAEIQSEKSIVGLPPGWIEEGVGFTVRNLTPLEYRLLSVLMLLPLVGTGGVSPALFCRHWGLFKAVSGTASDSEAQQGVIWLLLELRRRGDLASLAMCGLGFAAATVDRGAAALRATCEGRFSGAVRTLLGAGAEGQRAGFLRLIRAATESERLKANKLSSVSESSIEALWNANPGACEARFAPSVCRLAPPPPAADPPEVSLRQKLLERWGTGPVLDPATREEAKVQPMGVVELRGLPVLLSVLFNNGACDSETLESDKRVKLAGRRGFHGFFVGIVPALRAVSSAYDAAPAASREAVRERNALDLLRTGGVGCCALLDGGALSAFESSWEALRRAMTLGCEDIADVGSVEDQRVDDLLVCRGDKEKTHGLAVAEWLVNTHNDIIRGCVAEGGGDRGGRVSLFRVDPMGAPFLVDWSAAARRFAYLLPQLGPNASLERLDEHARACVGSQHGLAEVMLDDWPAVATAPASAVVPVVTVTQDGALPEVMAMAFRASPHSSSEDVILKALQWAQLHSARVDLHVGQGQPVSADTLLVRGEPRTSPFGLLFGDAAARALQVRHLTALQHLLSDALSGPDKADPEDELPPAFHAPLPAGWAVPAGVPCGDLLELLRTLAPHVHDAPPKAPLKDWIAFSGDQVPESVLGCIDALTLANLRDLCKLVAKQVLR